MGPAHVVRLVMRVGRADLSGDTSVRQWTERSACGTRILSLGYTCDTDLGLPEHQ